MIEYTGVSEEKVIELVRKYLRVLHKTKNRFGVSVWAKGNIIIETFGSEWFRVIIQSAPLEEI